jgi:hypothetical protein
MGAFDHQPTPTGPRSKEIAATPAEWVINAHADAASAFDNLMSREFGNVAEQIRIIVEGQNAYGFALAMATLNRVNPAVAQALAENLHDAAEAGDSYGEWLWQWGEELQAGAPITLPFEVEL